jgi:hypothetical protein
MCMYVEMCLVSHSCKLETEWMHVRVLTKVVVVRVRASVVMGCVMSLAWDTERRELCYVSLRRKACLDWFCSVSRPGHSESRCGI